MMISLVLISVVLVAQRPSGTNITTLWEKTAVTGNLPDYIGSNSNCHGMALGMMNGNPYLYVVTREAPYEGVHVLNPATGEEVGLLQPPGNDGTSDFFINAVEVSEDGVIFVSSMAYKVGASLNVYMYKNHTSAPKLMFSGLTVGTASKPRLGDRFTITGKYSDGSAKFYFADYGLTIARPQSNLYVLELVADTHVQGEYVCELEGGAPKTIDVNAHADCKNNNLAVYLPLGNGYYWMSTTGGLYYNDGVTGGQIYYDQFKNRSTGPYYVGERNGKHYMAYYEFEAGIAYLVSYTLPETPGGATIEASTPNLYYDGCPIAQNSYGYGGVAVDWRGEKPIIYYLAYNYGIGAYQVNSLSGTGIATPDTDSFLIKQNGNVLQITGKEEIESIELINLTGQRMASNRNASEITIFGEKGVYIAIIKSVSGRKTALKVFIE
jgi:hypothetical protein